jgi:hypothetical protein
MMRIFDKKLSHIYAIFMLQGIFYSVAKTMASYSAINEKNLQNL